MTRKIIYGLIAILLFASGCSSNDKEWDKQEFIIWYSTYWADAKVPPTMGLRYRGTDDEHHHFIMRPTDSFMFIRIKKEELPNIDVQPVPESSSENFYGYYEVDPLNNFKKIERVQESPGKP